MPGGAQHPHRRGHNGLEGGLQLRALCVQRAGQDVEGPYVEVADFSQVFLVAGGHCFCSSRRRSCCRHGSRDRCLCRPGGSQRESRAKFGTTYSHGEGRQTRAMALSGALSCPAAARRPATSQSGLALPVSGLCLAGMNPLRPIGCRGRDVGRRLGIWPPPGRRPGLLLTRRSVGRTVPAGGRLGDLPCPGAGCPGRSG